ncbi:MAG: restriction endonuclease subunit S [Flavobacterium sp.]|nr:restriction endonuclease subunit S [Flavobacterium sp.]
MKSSYKKLGNYIQIVNDRDADKTVDRLLGVSIRKVLMPSIANIIGTDMSTYKIIQRNQFAYGPVTSRNGDKISVALLEEYDKAIVSQAYTVFEVIDKNELLPEYLMMWFRRPEFDRYARFKSHGSAREIFDWAEMCDTELPIPSIEKQLEIVREYNVIQNRITLNNQLISKLEETAQAIYKQWFLDFEFPDENGLPYMSNGGEMVWCEELEKEIPVGWEVKSVKDFSSEMKSGSTPSRDENEYWNSTDYPWLKTGELKNSVVIDAEEYISQKGLNESSAKLLPVNSVLIAMYGEGKTKGQVGYLKIEAATNQACCAIICENEIKATFLYYHLRINRDEIVSIAIGGAQPNLSKNIIEELRLIEPTKVIMEKHPFVEIMKLKESYTFEIKSLMDLQNIVLAKMTKVETEIIIN